MTAKNKKISVPLFKMDIAAKTKKEVASTLDSTWLTTGPKVEKFEKMVTDYLGMKHSLAVSSCTTGLQMLLTVIGGGNSGEVITSPFTFVSSIEAIILSGSVPVLADIDPETLCLDPSEVTKKITSNTIAVMPVDIAGYPADYTKLKKICNDNNLPLISDSAHAIATKYKKKSIPAHTDASVFSFYSTKNLTCGEGGMIVSKHKDLIKIMRNLSGHGIDKSTIERNRTKSWEYDIVHPGFKANMSDIHAAVGIGQFSKFDTDQKKREKIAGKYMKKLSHLANYLSLPRLDKNIVHGWHLFIVRLNLPNLKIGRNKFIDEMATLGIECGVHYKPVFEFSYYKQAFDWSFNNYPKASTAGNSVVTLPLYPSLKLTEVDKVCLSIENIISEYGK